MTKRKSKKLYKGGFWPFSSDSSNAYSTPSTSWTEWFNSKTKNAMTSADSAISSASSSVTNSVSNLVDSTNKALSTDIPLTSSTTSNITGGRRRKNKTKRRKNRINKNSLKRRHVSNDHSAFL
jgi:hypothetical protein